MRRFVLFLSLLVVLAAALSAATTPALLTPGQHVGTVDAPVRAWARPPARAWANPALVEAGPALAAASLVRAEAPMSLTGFFALPRSLAGSDSSAAVLKMTGTPIPCGLAGSDSSATVFSSPIEALTILRPFDGPAEPWLSGHRGVDLAAAPNAAVLAPGPGVVTFAGWVVDRGVLTIQHPGGLRSSFEPVVDQVEVGSQVHAGQLIARVDPNINHCTNHAGSAEQVSCLHWGVRDGDTYLDPLLLITERPRVALLPDAK